MNLLCFDVSGPQGSVATFKEGVFQKQIVLEDRKKQASQLVPVIEEVLAQSFLTYASLEGLVTCIGPGSFTGIRIGLATAKGFEIALGIPTFGLSIFEVFYEAWRQKSKKCQEGEEKKNVLVVVEAFREDFFCQFYNGNGVCLPPSNLKVSDLPQYVTSDSFHLIGNAYPYFEEIRKIFGKTLEEEAPFSLTSKDLGDYVLGLTEEKKRAYAEQPLSPFYLRAPDSTAHLQVPSL